MVKNDICIINGSPHIGGLSDAICTYLSKILEGNVHILMMRDAKIEGCTHCLHCEHYSQKHFLEGYSKRICPLHTEQDMPYFTAMLQAKICIIVAPIYFYHVPACLKAFIDRSQAVYALQNRSREIVRTQKKMLYPILHAGREKGEALFTGSLVTLRYFGGAFGYTLGESVLLRGTDTKICMEDITNIIYTYCLNNMILSSV